MTNAHSAAQFNLDADVRATSEMAAALVPYIYKTELYGVISPAAPRLTVGGLLMRLQRLTALDNLLSPTQREAVAEAQSQFDQMRKDWTVAYEGKLAKELAVRLAALGSLLKECADEQRRCTDSYRSEIEKRVIVHGLAAEAKAHNILTPELEGGIRNFDAAIQRYVQPSDFIWDARLKAAYPQAVYGYLYASPAR